MSRVFTAAPGADQAPPFEGRLGLTIEETGVALSIARDTVYALIHAGDLVASKLGRRTIVHVVSVLRLLDRTRIVPRPRARRMAPPPTAKPPPARREHHRRGKAVQTLQRAKPATEIQPTV